MDVVLLLKSIIGLVVILGILVLFLVVPKKIQNKKNRLKEQENEKRVENAQKSNANKYSLEKLHAIVKRKASTTEDLQNALDLILEHYPNIPKKLGIRTHPGSDIYMDVIFKLCRHKNTNKTVIIKFTNNLEKLNPAYSKEIDDAMMRGLNSRGF